MNDTEFMGWYFFGMLLLGVIVNAFRKRKDD